MNLVNLNIRCYVFSIDVLVNPSEVYCFGATAGKKGVINIGQFKGRGCPNIERNSSYCPLQSFKGPKSFLPLMYLAPLWMAKVIFTYRHERLLISEMARWIYWPYLWHSLLLILIYLLYLSPNLYTFLLLSTSVFTL